MDMLLLFLSRHCWKSSKLRKVRILPREEQMRNCIDELKMNLETVADDM